MSGQWVRWVAVISLLAISSTVVALDQRSWDQRIDEADRRFVVLSAFGSEAVLDKETQLVWTRAPLVSSVMTWRAAVHMCLMAKVGEAQGWRLPSYTELASLAGRQGSLMQDHPFEGIPTGYFWTITSSSVSDHAYMRALLDGRSKGQPKADMGYVICVRGAGAADGF